MTNSMRKPLLIVGIILITLVCAALAFVLTQIILPLLALIVLSIPGSHPIAAPEAFPNTDIIYVGGKGVGFVNADGSGNESFPFRALGRSVLSEGMEMYLMTGDRKTLIPVSIGFGSYEGNVYMARPGEIAVNCGWGGIIQLASDQKHILTGTEQDTKKYLLTDCGTGSPPERSIEGASGLLSPDEKYSVETQFGWNEEEDRNKSDLILHDLATRKERVVEDGRFPAWSRDSQWLAYTGVDGIYIIQNSANTEPRRVVYIGEPSFDIPLYDNGRYPPTVSWSPDGHWLVYHLSDDGYDYPYSIFKVNLETGQATKLLEGGMSPYWIWPADKP